jgi:hypothetical protein
VGALYGHSNETRRVVMNHGVNFEIVEAKVLNIKELNSKSDTQQNELTSVISWKNSILPPFMSIIIRHFSHLLKSSGERTYT